VSEVKIKSCNVGKILQSIYDSEINIRLEWMWDAGMTWALLDDGLYPRVCVDDMLDGALTLTETQKAERMAIKGKFISKDWLERGCSYEIETAVNDLMLAIFKHYPDSEFSKEFNKSRKELEAELALYIGIPKCQDCGWKLGTAITDNCGCRGRAFKIDHDLYKAGFKKARELQEKLE